MSRWDVLKPGTVSKHDGGSSMLRSTRSSASPAAMSRGPTARPLVARPSSSVIVQNRPTFCQLQQEYLAQPKSSDRLVLLMLSLVKDQASIQSHENVVHSIVHHEVLVALDDSTRSQQQQHQPIILSSLQQVALLQALQSLLRVDAFASALLAPMVQTVTNDGCELQLANPIRLQLFRILQNKILKKGTNNNDIPKAACQTLVTALQKTYQQDQTQRHANALDVQIPLIQCFVQQELSDFRSTNSKNEQKSIINVLQLICALFHRHPEVIPSFVILLVHDEETALMEITSTRQPCSICSYDSRRDYSVFLSVAHGTNVVTREKDEAMQLALESVSMVLQHAPLGLWLCDGTMEGKPPRQPSTIRFPDRLSTGLKHILDIVCCHLTRSNITTTLSPSLQSLIIALLFRIPYHSLRPLLLSSAVCVVSALVHLLGSKCGNLAKEALLLFIDAAGGRSDPDGNVMPMCRPLQTWLDSSDGTAFVMTLLQSSDDLLSNTLSSKLLPAIFRSYPQLFFGHGKIYPAVLAALQQGERSRGTCHRRDQMILEVVEGILVGRRDYIDDERSLRFMHLVLSILQSAMMQGSNQCKRLACSCFGCFTKDDWTSLLVEDSLIQVRTLLSLCLDSNVTVKLRAEACKALGDVCSSLYESQHFDYACAASADATVTTLEICDALLRLTSDPNANVRSMSIFAIGNLCRACESSGSDLIPVSALESLGTCVLCLVNDASEKVAANAIRSVSHVIALVAKAVVDNKVDVAARFDLFIIETLHMLSTKIEAVLSLSQPTNAPMPLTWRERQATKKLGWGACNSLARIFGSRILEHRPLMDECDHVVSLLLQCIKDLGQINEKVVVSGSSALRSLGGSMLCRLDRKQTCILGSCAVLALCFIHESTTLSKKAKLVEEMHELLLLSLENMLIKDAAFILDSKHLTRDRLEFLLSWMIDKNCSPQAFSSFAVAMQSGLASIDVDLETRFMTRALGESEQDPDEF